MLMEPRGDLWSLACLHPTGSPILEHWKTKHLPGFRQYGRRCNSWKHLPFTAAAARLSTDCWRKIVSMFIFIASRPVYWAAFITLLQRRSNASSWRKLMTKLWLSYNNSTNNSSRIETRSSLRSRYGSLSLFFGQPQKRPYNADVTWLQIEKRELYIFLLRCWLFCIPAAYVVCCCVGGKTFSRPIFPGPECAWKSNISADKRQMKRCRATPHHGSVR